MSTTFQIPDKAALLPVSAVFTAAFNVPTPGFYDFTNTAANQNVLVIPLRQNVIYFIDTYSVGANITEEQFLESITTFPLLKLFRRFQQSNLYKNDLRIINFTDNGELSNFFYSDQANDQLLFTFTGVLRQLASMVGIATVRIQVSMNIYEIEEQYFSAAHRDAVNISMGQRNRR